MDDYLNPKHLRWKETFAGKPLPITANRHAMTGNFERHSHDFMELVLVTSGIGKQLTLHGDETLQAGRGLILHPGTWHAYHDCHNLIIYNCCFHLDMLEHEITWGQDDAILRSLFWSSSPFHQEAVVHRLDLTADQVSNCQIHLESLIALDQQHNFTKVRHLGHFLLFLSTFVHPLEQETEPITRETLHWAVELSMQYFEDHLSDPWTLADIAGKVGLDASYLVRLFNTHLHMSPMVYLARKRVEQAAILLGHTNLSIRSIGQEIGWPDANHFARRFKAQMGMSPTAYRTMYQNRGAQQDQTHDVVDIA